MWVLAFLRENVHPCTAVRGFVVHPFFLISPGKLVLTRVVVITFQLFWRMMDHLERVQRWKDIAEQQFKPFQ